MKLQFSATQDYQLEAVKSVCFVWAFGSAIQVSSESQRFALATYRFLVKKETAQSAPSFFVAIILIIPKDEKVN